MAVSQNTVTVIEADLSVTDHRQAILELMDAYAADPMGNGMPLPGEVKERLLDGLQRHPTTRIFLALVARRWVGIAVCFGGYSTFQAKPLINVSDFFVYPAYRGLGLGTALLGAVEVAARASGCCKLTLEVQENNRRARAVYEKLGFQQAVYVAEAGGSLALTKRLTTP